MRQTMLMSYQAEELLKQPIAVDNHLQNVADGLCLIPGVAHVRTVLIEVTARRCNAVMFTLRQGTVLCECIDILVVEVPPKQRKKGIFHKFIFILEQQKYYIRFHNVQNLSLQDALIQRGYYLDGEFWVKTRYA